MNLAGSGRDGTGSRVCDVLRTQTDRLPECEREAFALNLLSAIEPEKFRYPVVRVAKPLFLLFLD